MRGVVRFFSLKKGYAIAIRINDTIYAEPVAEQVLNEQVSTFFTFKTSLMSFSYGKKPYFLILGLIRPSFCTIGNETLLLQSLFDDFIINILIVSLLHFI